MDVQRGMSATEKARILLVEDDAGVRRSLQLLLQASGFDVRAYANAARLLDDATALAAICLIADYRLADGDGIRLLGALRARGWMGPAVLITAFGSAELTETATAAGFDAIFEKPLRKHLLVQAVERLVRQAAARG